MPPRLLRVLAVLSLASSHATAAQMAPVIRTGSGFVQGALKTGLRSYLGIPYAAPPVGNLRWRPPQPVTPWRSVRSSLSYGNTCPQNFTAQVFATPSRTEDCLYLNVFGPAEISPRRRHPVMVFIHGGGLIDGESDDYDASKLVRKGGVVVVTFNYRVGVLGMFAHPTSDREGHAFANYAIMDQQFALRWVRRNIAAFGGDPKRVTIFGESAGGASVIAHLVAPTSRGLFQGAIVQSGAFAIRRYPGLGAPAPLAAAEGLGLKFAAAAGCSMRVDTCLRALPVERVLELQQPYLLFGPIIDGAMFTQSFASAFAAGRFNHVPLINGSNHDEWRWFVGQAEALSGAPLAASAYPNALAEFFGRARTPLIASVYPLSDYASPSLALAAAITDAQIACPARRLNILLAGQVPVYAYEFNDPRAPIYFPPVSFAEKAYHTADLQYLFPLYHGASGTSHPLSADQEKLSNEMVAWWTGFAAKGSADAPWTRYEVALDNFFWLAPESPVTTEPTFDKMHRCEFWDGQPDAY